MEGRYPAVKRIPTTTMSQGATAADIGGDGEGKQGLQRQSSNKGFAYVTLVTSDAYVDGALVLLHSLRQTLTPHSILCLATTSDLSQHSLDRLYKHFDGVIGTTVLQSTDNEGLGLLGRPDLRSTLTKIQLWNPALFGAWDAICYLDADTLVRLPIDDIFSRVEPWRHDNHSSWKNGGLIAAAPDTGWPDCFNSGVLLLAPGHGCYEDLARHVTSSSSASFDGADQGLLNEHFGDWASASSYRRLPFLYNATANVYYTYPPALQRFGHDVRVVHFIGVSKPWHWERTAGGRLLSDDSTPERWRQLVNLWWSIHDECVSGWKHWMGPFDKSMAFGDGYHHIKESPPSSMQRQLNTLADEQTGAATYSKHEGPAQETEISGWDMDWSWASNRVHPLDYAYLETHAPEDSDHYHHKSQHSNDMEESVILHREDLANNDLGPSAQQHLEDVEVVSDNHGEHLDDHFSAHNDYHHGHGQQEQDKAPPVWMQSQRPWEDVAREGWKHHNGFEPHSYDQSYAARHIHHHYQHQQEDHRHEYAPMPLPENKHLYEATQVLLQPQQQQQPEMAMRHENHHFYHHQDSHSPQHEQNTHASSSAETQSNISSSRNGSSPLYYPKPKSPIIVNPVALWESDEEQARRRKWAEHVQDNGSNGHQKIPSSVQASATAGMGNIHVNQLPPDTPWKVTHVRQRSARDSPMQQRQTQAGMQFKEGVANGESARDAAGNLLRRWNEAIAACNLQQQHMSPGQIVHSMPNFERGTDAIKLETTVSCEAEDSRGEKTVYRFTLSSTLDIGGSQSDGQQQSPLSPFPVAATNFDHVHQDTDNEEPANDVSNINVLRQPKNYHEPPISRRSSLVQMQSSSQLPAGVAARGHSGFSDQFEEADERYWRLQKQLIDVQMSQQQQQKQRQPTGYPGLSVDTTSTTSSSEENYQSEKMGLRSPPTPTPTFTGGEGFGRSNTTCRRSSAFRVADPAELASTEDTSVAIATEQPTSSQGVSSASPSIESHLTRHRSSSSPHLSRADGNGSRSPVANPISSANNNGGSQLISPLSSKKKDSLGLQLPLGGASPRRNKSFSGLRRLATQRNAVEAATAAGAAFSSSKKDQKPTFADSTPNSIPPPPASPSENGNDRKDGDSERYKSAIGRNPTPYPGMLSKRSAKLANEEKDGIELSSASVGTPFTHNRKKVQPSMLLANEDEGKGVPPKSDQPLDAQWLRIINGAAPQRAVVTPKISGKPLAVATGGRDGDAVLVNPAKTSKDGIQEGDAFAQAGNDDKENMEPAVPKAPRQDNKSTEEMSRKVPSTRSFLNLTSQEFDTRSDSGDEDMSDCEMEEQFWARAIRPQKKSGASTPYSPGRRKSVVEMSNTISPRDVDEWMHWKGNSPQQQSINSDVISSVLPTPPNSKEKQPVASSDDEEDALVMYRSQPATTTAATKPDEALALDSDDDGNISFAEIVEKNNSIAASSSATNNIST